MNLGEPEASFEEYKKWEGGRNDQTIKKVKINFKKHRFFLIKENWSNCLQKKKNGVGQGEDILQHGKGFCLHEIGIL